MTSTEAPLLTPEEMLSRARNFWTWLPEAEVQRLSSVAVRLQRAFSSIPWHARRAAKDPDYWLWFTSGRPNS